MEITKEELFLEIDEIYSEWHGGDLHIGKERTERIKQVLDKAINYSLCSTQLKSEDVISFEEWKERFTVKVSYALSEYRGDILSDKDLILAYNKDVELFNSLIV